MITLINRLIFGCLIISLLSSCELENLKKLVKVSEDRGKPCIIGIWPAVLQGDEKYKMTQNQATVFVKNVSSELRGYRSEYRSIKMSRNIPQACKNYLWHNNKNLKTLYRNNCMRVWGNNSRPEQCKANNTYVIGSTIKNGRAELHIIRLDQPYNFANKKTRIAEATSLNRLAKELGKKIEKELK